MHSLFWEGNFTHTLTHRTNTFDCLFGGLGKKKYNDFEVFRFVALKNKIMYGFFVSAESEWSQLLNCRCNLCYIDEHFLTN